MILPVNWNNSNRWPSSPQANSFNFNRSLSYSWPFTSSWTAFCFWLLWHHYALAFSDLATYFSGSFVGSSIIWNIGVTQGYSCRTLLTTFSLFYRTWSMALPPTCCSVSDIHDQCWPLFWSPNSCTVSNCQLDVPLACLVSTSDLTCPKLDSWLQFYL